MQSKITVVLESKTELLALATFRVALDQLTTILNEIERTMSDSPHRRLKWGISQLSLNSPATIGLENLEIKENDLANRTSRVFIEGLKSLMAQRKRPEYFNNIALENARALAKLTNDGLTNIRLLSDTPDLFTEIKEQVAVNVTGILESFDYIGSIQGTLEVLSAREGQPIYFRIRDVVTQHNVKCYIPEQIIEEALNAFRKRVIVYGIIKSDAEGDPTSVRVEQIEVMPDQKDLPQAQDVIDSLKNQLLSLARYDNDH